MNCHDYFGLMKNTILINFDFDSHIGLFSNKKIWQLKTIVN